MLFFRVEHSEQVNMDLLKYSKNCLTKVKSKRDHEMNKAIHCGPWGLIENFTNKEVKYMADISMNHALPYYKDGRPFDSEINEIVQGPLGIQDNLIKEYYIFGCASCELVNEYFPVRYRAILHSHGFHLAMYSSNFVHTSRFQSVMNIDKTHEYVGAESLV